MFVLYVLWRLQALDPNVPIVVQVSAGNSSQCYSFHQRTVQTADCVGRFEEVLQRQDAC